MKLEYGSQRLNLMCTFLLGSHVKIARGVIIQIQSILNGANYYTA